MEALSPFPVHRLGEDTLLPAKTTAARPRELPIDSHSVRPCEAQASQHAAAERRRTPHAPPRPAAARPNESRTACIPIRPQGRIW